MYKITAYTKARAKKIGVNVRPSKTAGKKIDVYKNETAPVKEFYAAQNKWIKIDGFGSIQVITTRLFATVDSL